MIIIHSIKSLYLYHFLKNYPARVYLIYKRDENYVERGYHIWGGDKGITICKSCRLKQLVSPTDSYESYCGGSFFFCKKCQSYNKDPIARGSQVYNYTGKIIIFNKDNITTQIKLDKMKVFVRKDIINIKKW